MQATEPAAEPSRGQTGPSLHLGSVTVLLVLAGVFWAISGGVGEVGGVVRPEVGYPISIALAAGAVGLLSRTRAGLWLARFDAILLVGIACLALVLTLVARPASGMWWQAVVLIGGPIVIVCGGAGIGILRTLRREPVVPTTTGAGEGRADTDATNGPGSP